MTWKWPLVLALTLVLAAGLAVPAIRHLREQPPPPPPAVHLSFAAPPGSEPGAGDDGLDAAISPDGRQIVFVASTNGVARLWRHTLATGRAEALARTDGAQLPAWKRGGGIVSFFAGGRLKQVTLADGTVSDLAEAPSPGGSAWLPDGSLLFAPAARGPIRRMLAGRVSDATSLGAGDRGHLFPAPAGSAGDFTYVAVRENGRRTVRLVSGGGERELIDTSGHAQIAGGHLIYARDRVLLTQRVDEKTQTMAGPSVVLSPAVGVSGSGHGMFAASDRLLLFADARPRPRQLTWLDPVTATTSPIAEPGDLWQVRLAPDDRAAAVTTRDPLLRTLDVVVISVSGAAEPQTLTRAIAADTDPVWSADGARVVFRSTQSGPPRLFSRRVGIRGAPDEPVQSAADGDTATAWEGSRLLLHTAGGPSGADVWMLETATGAREPIAREGFNETDARWSPDGRWIAFVSDESGQPDVYALPQPQGERVRVSSAGGSRPRWSRDSRSVYFLRGSQIMRADLLDGPMPRFGAARTIADLPGIRDFDTAHRSDRLAALVSAPATTSPTIAAVVDWRSLMSAAQ